MLLFVLWIDNTDTGIQNEVQCRMKCPENRKNIYLCRDQFILYNWCRCLKKIIIWFSLLTQNIFAFRFQVGPQIWEVVIWISCNLNIIAHKIILPLLRKMFWASIYVRKLLGLTPPTPNHWTSTIAALPIHAIITVQFLWKQNVNSVSLQ